MRAKQIDLAKIIQTIVYYINQLTNCSIDEQFKIIRLINEMCDCLMRLAKVKQELIVEERETGSIAKNLTAGDIFILDLFIHKVKQERIKNNLPIWDIKKY